MLETFSTCPGTLYLQCYILAEAGYAEVLLLWIVKNGSNCRVYWTINVSFYASHLIHSVVAVQLSR
jgi:hypothetical protein